MHSHQVSSLTKVLYKGIFLLIFTYVREGKPTMGEANKKNLWKSHQYSS